MDAVVNMIACGNILKLHHTTCIAHTLNLIVKKAIEQTPWVDMIRTRVRRIVAYFRTNTSAKERLTQVQEQMGMPVLKCIQEMDTC